MHAQKDHARYLVEDRHAHAPAVGKEDRPFEVPFGHGPYIPPSGRGATRRAPQKALRACRPPPAGQRGALRAHEVRLDRLTEPVPATT